MTCSRARLGFVFCPLEKNQHPPLSIAAIAMTAHDNKDCLYEAGKVAGISGGIGVIVSAMQNTVQKHKEGAKGVFTRTGSTIAFFGNIVADGYRPRTCS